VQGGAPSNAVEEGCRESLQQGFGRYWLEGCDLRTLVAKERLEKEAGEGRALSLACRRARDENSSSWNRSMHANGGRPWT
jgi:hypothetical protein